MGGIALPALHLNPPPQQPNVLEQYGQLMQLKNQMANAPLQRQILEQTAQSGQMQVQQEQQGMKDQQAFRSAMSDPSMQGKTIGDVADSLAKSGAISQQSWVAAKKADVEQRKSLSELDEKQLSNFKAAHEATQQLYNNVMNMDDAAMQQNWPQIAQQYDAIPGNNKMPLDPNKPLTKQQLSQFGPVLAMGNNYFDQELARREKETATKKGEVDLQKAQQDAQFGPIGQAADAKYSFLEKKSALGQPITADDQAWMKGYKAQKLLVPATTATIRMEGLGQTREYPVYDKKQNATVMVTPLEINRAAKEEPGRYTSAAYTPESIGPRDATNYFVKGKGGQQITAYNTALNHLDVLDKLSGDLGNSNIQVFNKAAQAWAEQTGSPAPANFAAAKNAMAGEVGAALKASGATDQEIEKVDSTFSRIQSPAQLKGAINTYRTLLKGKAQNLKVQYDEGMQGKPAFQGAPATPSASDPFAQFGGKAHP